MQQTVTVKVRWKVGRFIGYVPYLQPLPALNESEGKPSHQRQRRKEGKEPRQHEIEEDEHHLGHHRKQNRSEEDADGELMEEAHLQPYLC